MADPNGGLKRQLSEDGGHPNKVGYDVTGPLAENAIGRALRTK